MCIMGLCVYLIAMCQRILGVRYGMLFYEKNQDRLGGLLDEIKKLSSSANIIPCGGDECSIAQSREQWTDGANALAVGPGKIILYERNKYTLKELQKHG